MTLFYTNNISRLYHGDTKEVMKSLPSESVHCVVTSPPYWGLRDYQVEGQLGLEPTPEEYVANMVEVFREVWRVLNPTGTVWLNLGDSYSGSGRGPSKWNSAQEMRSNQTPPSGLKPKDLVGIPWRVAFALQADGWYLRSDIIWNKPNPMPESVTDRPTKAHEYIFLLTKNPRYYYDADAIREISLYPNDNRGARSDSRRGTDMNSMNGKTGLFRNKRSVWEITTHPYPEAHFATYPEKLVEPCILAGTSEKGVCAKCSKPWVKLTEVVSVPDRDTRDNRIGVIPGRDSATRMNSKEMKRVEKADLGWQPTCECSADTVSATVLDPFVGSGTTCAVSQRLGRHSIGIDASAEYLKLAKERIGRISMPMF